MNSEGILFRDSEHKTVFESVLRKMDCGPSDVYRISFAYLIALDDVCRKHISQLYDFAQDCICPDALDAPWQTSCSLRTVELAVNLYNSYCGADAADIFAYGEYNVYYVQALKLRFPCGVWD